MPFPGVLPCVYTAGVLSTPLPVSPEDLGQVSLGEPHANGAHQDPQNGQLVQHLAQEAEGGMEVRGANA